MDMWPFKFPYTNFHELNLDWVLGTVKSNEERISANELKIRLLGGDDPLNALHPVGSLFFSVEEESPAALFGGVWEQLPNRFLLGAGNEYNVGTEGGNRTVTLTKENIPPLPLFYYGNNTPARPCVDGSVVSIGREQGGSVNAVNAQNPNPTPVNIMPPFLAVYMWKRVS